MPQKETLPEQWEKLGVPLLRSTFLVRPNGPEVIMDVDENTLIGPFCQHCGNRALDHSTPGSRCPGISLYNLLPAPMCDCHGSVEQAQARLDPAAFSRALNRARTRDRNARKAAGLK